MIDMEEIARTYEKLICKAHNCDRWGISGANADNYRGLIEAFILWQDMQRKPDISLKDVEVYFGRYARKCGAISAYIETAIDIIGKEYDNRMSDEQKKELNDIKSLLRESYMEQIDDSICRVKKLLLNFCVIN